MYSLYIENSEIESEGRVWRKYQVCRCYFYDLYLGGFGFFEPAFETTLVIDL